MSRRVVITGAGVVSSVGVGIKDFWAQCLQAKSMVTPVPPGWEKYADLHCRVWAPLPDIKSESFGITRTERLQFDPVTVLALGTARDALEHAGFQPAPVEGDSRVFTVPGVDSARIGVFIGTGLGGAYTFLQNHTHHLLAKPRAELIAYAKKSNCARAALGDVLAALTHGPRFNPFEVSMVMPNAPSAAVGIKYGFTGPNVNYSVACASGTIAVGHAYSAIRSGRVDMALTGGCEYFGDEHGHIFRAFDVSGTLMRDCANPQTSNRPFDEKHSGFLFSQGGAAVLVLEELAHAQRRGADIMAEVIGYAETFDAYSMMRLAPGGGQIEHMLHGALNDAGIRPDNVDYINTHGTGTKNNDETEAGVIGRVFRKSVLVNATKSLLGHAIGASGAIEILVTALSLRDQTTHICKNLDTPIRDLNFVRAAAQFELNVGISQSFAFGGHNAALVLRRFH